MIISIIIAILITCFNSCTASDMIEGVVREVTENTITIVTKEEAVVTFSTRRARIKGYTQPISGSLVEISYSDDISDGFGNALIVESLTDNQRE